MFANGWAVWFCKPTIPLQSNDKLSKAYKQYRLLAFRFCAWAVQNRHNERT